MLRAQPELEQDAGRQPSRGATTADRASPR